jgi:hypothetical protein
MADQLIRVRLTGATEAAGRNDEAGRSENGAGRAGATPGARRAGYASAAPAPGWPPDVRMKSVTAAATSRWTVSLSMS